MVADRSLDVVGAVMAGGRGTRMGRPKAAVELGGRPLIAYPLAALAGAGLEAVVVAKRDTPLPELEVTVWHEPNEPAHPLCGILAALEQAGRPILACGCDMPFLVPKLLLHLATRSRPLVVPRAGGRLHPLLARYGPALLDPLGRALDSAEPLHEVVSRLDPFLVDEHALRRFGDPERLLFNLNTPEDLARAEDLLKGS
jgi:molybdenum cofactor guanylyltransferase